MTIPHSFVLARLNLNRSLYWISSSAGHAVANRIKPRPFAAVRMEASWIDTYDPMHFLLLVSNTKPPAEFPGYVPIFPHHDGSRSPVRITPPLPHGGQNLYIHTGNPMYFSIDPEEQNNWKTDFVINAEDCARLYRYTLEDDPLKPTRVRERKILKAGSGGNDRVGSRWSTFSAVEPTEGLNRTDLLEFDISPLANMDATGLNIYDEVKFLNSIGKDYSWVGVSDTIRYVRELDADLTPLSKFPVGSALTGFESTCDAVALSAMTIPFDGAQPKPVSEQPTQDQTGWEDEWSPGFALTPKSLLTAAPNGLSIIWFDMHGTISDRETAIKDALQPILDRDPMLRTQDEGLALYLECEAKALQPSTPSERIAAGLQVFGDTIGVDTQNQQHAFVSKVTGLRTWPDVSRALKALRQKGYRLVASSNFNPAALGSKLEVLFDHIFENDCAFHEALPDAIFDQVLGYCRKEYAADASQVLLVTSSAYRGIERASPFGVPTAHLRRPGYLEGSENATELVLTKPGYVVHDLLGLCDKLGVNV